MKATTKLKLKKLFHLPIYRIDVLKAVRENHSRHLCLCSAIAYALRPLTGLYPCSEFIQYYFPLFGGKEVFDFGAHTNYVGNYWWPVGDWSAGRLDYLDWLIEQYKNDKTDISGLLGRV